MAPHVVIALVVYLSSGTEFAVSCQRKLGLGGPQAASSSSSICGELHSESICSIMLQLGINPVVFRERHQFLENKLAAENTDYFLNYFLGLRHYLSS